ncbi:MAG: helicase-related protein, partial [Flavobacteriales bacterium]
KKKNKNTATLNDDVVNISVAGYLCSPSCFKKKYKLYRVAVDFKPVPQPPIPPYLLGLLLSDRALKSNGASPAIATINSDIVQHCQQMADLLGLKLEMRATLGRPGKLCYFKRKEDGANNILAEHLARLNLYGLPTSQNFIPAIYKAGAREIRASLLASLIDVGGYKDVGRIEYATDSKQLAHDVVFIASSLGLQASKITAPCGACNKYKFFITGDFNDIPIKNKSLVIQKSTRSQKTYTAFSVKFAGKGSFYGFTVDGDNLYLMGDFTVTHNSGKTIMLSGVAGQFLEGSSGKACILAHRDELTEQNRQKFSLVNPNLTTSVFNASCKDWSGQAVFAMVQTLCRDANISTMPLIDLLVIDEAHHAAAATYHRIIETVKKNNPAAAIFGVTATPNRGDKKGLRTAFTNVADQITLPELIASGHLVPPKTFVIDVGTQKELAHVNQTAADYDMEAVAAIMNKETVTDAVIEHWQEKAGDRPTVVFCSTVNHALDVHKAFKNAGITAEVVYGDLPKDERREALERFEKGQSQVVVNVAVLTEGFDYPPTSCVVLLRPSSHQSTMVQMIGRGLRIVNPETYPNITKTDCIILDFGISVILHGTLEQDIDLGGQDGEDDKGEKPTKLCPECEAVVPIACRICALCGYVWEKEEQEDKEPDIHDNFKMIEIDLLERSSFCWCDLFGDDAAIMATGFTAWAGIFCLDGLWYGVGGGKNVRAALIAKGERSVCLAVANDWMNTYETEDAAKKSLSWLSQSPTAGQLKYLPSAFLTDFGLTRYRASCLLAFRFNKKSIQARIFAAAKKSKVT